MHGIDFIGDVRGRVGALTELLGVLGYAERNGAWRNPSRRAVFLGSYLGGRSASLEAMRIVRSMCEAGSATALMGRVEFDLVAYALDDPENPGQAVKVRRGAAHRRHAALVETLGGEGSRNHREAVGFMATLPLWFETANVRAVHAYHDAEVAAVLRDAVDADRRLTISGLRSTVAKGPARLAARTILDGPRVRLPAGGSVEDEDGRRGDALARWWVRAPTCWREAVLGFDGEGASPPPAWDRAPDRPILFGRYDLTDKPFLTDPVAGCLSFDAPGAITAYRWDGERTLSDKKLVTARFHPWAPGRQGRSPPA